MSRRILIAWALILSALGAAPKNKPKTPAAAPSAAVSSSSSIWPAKLGPYTLLSQSELPSPGPQNVWEEYGFDAAEKATYKKPGQTLTAIAYRMKDPTGAYSALELLAPAEAKRSPLSDHALTTRDGTLVQIGNYVLSFQGAAPDAAEIKQLENELPKVDLSPAPTLHVYLPKPGLIANSERYITGPAALAAVEPRIPPSVAAFRLGAEAESALYRSDRGDIRLLVFSYPTPQIARKELSDFQAVPGAAVKRSGPLIAVTISPADPDQAERVLAGVKYEATVTENEASPRSKLQKIREVGNFLLGIIVLFLALAGVSVLFGVFMGSLRTVLERLGIRRAKDPFTSLHLSDR